MKVNEIVTNNSIEPKEAERAFSIAFVPTQNAPYGSTWIAVGSL